MRHMKSIRFLLLIALLVIAIAPVHAQDLSGQVVIPAGGKIHIVVQTDLTNAIPEFGEDIWQGVQVAASFLNDAGGIKGFPIELSVEDDRCTPDFWTSPVEFYNVKTDMQVVRVGLNYHF